MRLFSCLKTNITITMRYQSKLSEPIHEVQLVTYLKLTGKALGLLINFNVPVLKNGIKRKINARIEYTGTKIR